MRLIAYLNFEGNTLEAIEFYKSVFGGEITNLSYFKDIPGFESSEMKDIGNYLTHGRLETEFFNIYFSDSYKTVNFGDAVSLSIQCDSVEQIDALYPLLSKDAKAFEVALEDTFWGARYASFTDKFNIIWQLNYDYKK